MKRNFKKSVLKTVSMYACSCSCTYSCISSCTCSCPPTPSEAVASNPDAWAATHSTMYSKDYADSHNAAEVAVSGVRSAY